MTALRSARRVGVPTYYLGRPASLEITRLSTRRRGARAVGRAEPQDRSQSRRPAGPAISSVSGGSSTRSPAIPTRRRCAQYGRGRAAPSARALPGRLRTASGAAMSSSDLRSAATPRNTVTSPPAIITTAPRR
jgi:hypothetical protein